MSGDEVIRPFRWDIKRRSQLGSLPEIELPEPYPECTDDLLVCCARVVGFAGDSDLMFIGRSPHPLFDLLSGLVLDTSWSDRLRIFNVSLHYMGGEVPSEEELRSIYPYMSAVGLEPHALARRSRTVALIDVVGWGSTFETLLRMLQAFSDSSSVEWRSVARRVRIVGLTVQTKTSPHTWRWQQHSGWVEQLRPYAIKNVSIPERLACYLASEAPKTSDSFTPDLWAEPNATRPARDKEAREALALAVRLFDLGRAKETRHLFARELARQPAMREAWFRSLVLELKR